MNKIELASFFDESRFIPSLKSRTKDGVLDELVKCFVSAESIRNSAIVLEMVKRREQLGSTGIGRGIAIPHGRTTAAPELMIAFGCSNRGIEWEAMDGEPAHLIFMVLAPPQEQDNVYLPALGCLVESLSHTDNREKFKEVKSFTDFINLLKDE